MAPKNAAKTLSAPVQIGKTHQTATHAAPNGTKTTNATQKQGGKRLNGAYGWPKFSQKGLRRPCGAETTMQNPDHETQILQSQHGVSPIQPKPRGQTSCSGCRSGVLPPRPKPSSGALGVMVPSPWGHAPGPFSGPLNVDVAMESLGGSCWEASPQTDMPGKTGERTTATPHSTEQRTTAGTNVKTNARKKCPAGLSSSMYY